MKIGAPSETISTRCQLQKLIWTSTCSTCDVHSAFLQRFAWAPSVLNYARPHPAFILNRGKRENPFESGNQRSDEN